MRILLLSHSFNSLTQRLWVELRGRGHTVSLELDIADAVTEEAVALFRPDVVLAPFLKRRIPESVWSRHLCLVVHPGIVGDRGPAALDRAILRDEAAWGLTVLQAIADFDAGPVWASVGFPMRGATKSSLYRGEVTQAALAAVLQALARLPADAPAPAPQAGQWWPALPQAERAIDWATMPTAEVLRRIRCGDGHPGTADRLFEAPCHLFDAHDGAAAATRVPGGTPGELIARRGPALLRRTVDGAVWIGHVRLAALDAEGLPSLKLPATLAFAEAASTLPELPTPLDRADAADWDELHYREAGTAGARVGLLAFDFHNGAMSTRQCERLRDALRFAKARDTQVLVLLGGEDFFSNGIHLNLIEAAAQRPGDSAADESMRNIQAMDDLVLELLTTTDRLTVAALRGNAGAGGVFLALAADAVWAHEGVVLNPHYKNMGNLYGSEYWSYVLPRRVGAERARQITQGRQPLSAPQAQALGLVDEVLARDARGFEAALLQQALALAAHNARPARVAAKAARRAADEAERPLQAYRDAELAQMHRNFYGFDPSYHVARYHFVRKLPHAWTPRHLALHREGRTP
ncbi:MAG: hydrogenase maturation protein [Burkholderiales bacterium]|nr:hydrogenase maturation protein [Burkholderiales bacterium]